MLAADDGAYVVPVDDRMGYAETALTEPWACVEAAYTQRRRLAPLAGGRLLDRRPRRTTTAPYDFGRRDRAPPGDRRSAAPRRRSSSAIRAGAATGASVSRGVAGRRGRARGPYDDVIVLGRHEPAAIARAGDAVAFRGTINLVSDEPLAGPVEIDVGRLHYHYVAWLGTTGLGRVGGLRRDPQPGRAPAPAGSRSSSGAAGPMGQMHIERALAMAGGPRLVVGVDLDADRLAAARAKLAAGRDRARPRAPDRGARAANPTRSRRSSAGCTGGRGADDVIVTAPSGAGGRRRRRRRWPPTGCSSCSPASRSGRASRSTCRRSSSTARSTPARPGRGSPTRPSSSTKTLAGELEPRRALAAVGGMETAAEALQALVDGRFPGKIVVFPQLTGLPLTAVCASSPTIRRSGRSSAPTGRGRRAAEQAAVRPARPDRRPDVIVTVTPNPSIDRTLRVPAVRRGEVVRADRDHREAGGKGINVARALDEMGVRGHRDRARRRPRRGPG